MSDGACKLRSRGLLSYHQGSSIVSPFVLEHGKANSSTGSTSGSRDLVTVVVFAGVSVCSSLEISGTKVLIITSRWSMDGSAFSGEGTVLLMAQGGAFSGEGTVLLLTQGGAFSGEGTGSRVTRGGAFSGKGDLFFL